MAAFEAIDGNPYAAVRPAVVVVVKADYPAWLE